MKKQTRDDWVKVYANVFPSDAPPLEAHLSAADRIRQANQ